MPGMPGMPGAAPGSDSAAPTVTVPCRARLSLFWSSRYTYFPGVVNVKDQESPCSRLLESSSAGPEVLRMRCSPPPVACQVTLVPGATVRSLGDRLVPTVTVWTLAAKAVPPPKATTPATSSRLISPASRWSPIRPRLRMIRSFSIQVGHLVGNPRLSHLLIQLPAARGERSLFVGPRSRATGARACRGQAVVAPGMGRQTRRTRITWAISVSQMSATMMKRTLIRA